MTTPPSAPVSVRDGVREKDFVERRRSRRRRLQNPSEVSLHGTGSEVDWTAAGVLLNVSPDGLACRVSAKAAHALTVGQALHVLFRIGTTSTVFDLKARITNITPAGTTHCVVLGLEFLADRRLKSVQTKLQESLRRAGDEEN